MTATVATDALVTPEFVRSAEILVELHRLHAAGRLSGPDGDRLRDESLPLWCELSDEQQLILDGLSEDLHSFTDPAEPRQLENPQFLDAEKRITLFDKQNNWVGALAHCRRWRARIDAIVLSGRRAWAWWRAGVPAVAVAFADHALLCDPNHWQSGWLRLDALSQIGGSTFEKACQVARANEKSAVPGEMLWIAFRDFDNSGNHLPAIGLLTAAAIALGTAPGLSEQRRASSLRFAFQVSLSIHRRANILDEFSRWLADVYSAGIGKLLSNAPGTMATMPNTFNPGAALIDLRAAA